MANLQPNGCIIDLHQWSPDYCADEGRWDDMEGGEVRCTAGCRFHKDHKPGTSIHVDGLQEAIISFSAYQELEAKYEKIKSTLDTIIIETDMASTNMERPFHERRYLEALNQIAKEGYNV